mgnify:CR=1 FL=1
MIVARAGRMAKAFADSARSTSASFILTAAAFHLKFLRFGLRSHPPVFECGRRSECARGEVRGRVEAVNRTQMAFRTCNPQIRGTNSPQHYPHLLTSPKSRSHPHRASPAVCGTQSIQCRSFQQSAVPGDFYARRWRLSSAP